MNAERMRMLAITALGCVALGIGVWFFYGNFEEKWIAREGASQAASQNQMLAATRWLEQNHHPVNSTPTLSVALFKPLPRGTLIFPGNGGTMLTAQVDRLLDWTAQGNTLIVSPLWASNLAAKPAKKEVRDKEEGEQGDKKNQADKAAKGGGKSDAKGDDQDDDDEDVAPSPAPTAAPAQAPVKPRAAVVKTVDSLGTRFGLSSTNGMFQAKQICRDPRLVTGPNTKPSSADEAVQKAGINFVDCTTAITLPGAAYALRVDGAGSWLQSRSDVKEQEDEPSATPYPVPLFSDDQGRAVRVFQHGKGRVVFVARNYFDNASLPYYDHAELLLGLAGLNQGASAVMIVQRIDIPSWRALLWAGIPYTIGAIALFLALLFWASVRRFGPLLPEPDDRRRSLIEHVDASGRWLWKSEVGRQVLLAAVRRGTEKVLARRAPELRKLSSDERIAKLAQLLKIKPVEIERALLDAPARVPAEFTHQMQTLQLLRKHYER